MATDAEILVTKAALDARLGGIPDLTALTYRSQNVDLSHLLVPDEGWVPGVSIRVNRNGVMVSLTVRSIIRDTAGAGYSTVFTLPEWARPALPKFLTTWRGVRAQVETGGRVRLSDPGTASDYLSLDFMTAAPAPTGPVA